MDEQFSVVCFTGSSWTNRRHKRTTDNSRIIHDYLHPSAMGDPWVIHEEISVEDPRIPLSHPWMIIRSSSSGAHPSVDALTLTLALALD